MIRRGDVVVNEEPSRALFRQSAQRSLRRLLNISFFCRCCTQRHRKARKSTQEPRARLGRAPTHTRIETAVAVRILNGQRSLAHTAHALHCRATYMPASRQQACPASGWRRADQVRPRGL